MGNQLVFTDNSFFQTFNDLDMTNYLTEIKAEFATIQLSQIKALVSDIYLNDENVSIEKFHNEFFPLFLSRMSEGFTSVADFLDEENFEDYFEFLQEEAHVLFKETGDYLVSDLSKISELATAFVAIRFTHSSSDFVAIAENDFEDYIREYVLELGWVNQGMESYVDWEKYANAAQVDYKSATISASNTLNYSGDVFVRAWFLKKDDPVSAGFFIA